MKKYIFQIKSFLEDNKELTSNEITEKAIKKFVALDNKYSRALYTGNFSEEDLMDLELQLQSEKEFLIHYLLGGVFGYNIRTVDGCNQWYREAELIEEIDIEENGSY